MSREEIVLLVSRALAVIQAAGALLDVTYVPAYLFSANHYASDPGYLGMIHRIELISMLTRIVSLSVLAWPFWRCGPWVAGLLLPTSAETTPTASESLKLISRNLPCRAHNEKGASLSPHPFLAA
jgi:hypothetical protein